MSEVIQDLEHRRWQAMIDVDLPTLDLLLHPNLRYTHSTAAVDTKESVSYTHLTLPTICSV